LGFACTLRDPGLRLIPGLVEGEEAGLAAALDELVGLCDELAGEDPGGELGIRGDRAGLRIPADLRDLGGRVREVGLDYSVGCDGRCPLEPVREEELGIVFADGWTVIRDVWVSWRTTRTHLWRTWLRREREKMGEMDKKELGR